MIEVFIELICFRTKKLVVKFAVWVVSFFGLMLMILILKFLLEKLNDMSMYKVYNSLRVIITKHMTQVCCKFKKNYNDSNLIHMI